LCYVPPAVGPMVVALGTTFRWIYGVPENGGMLVKRYRVEERSGDMIEYQTYYLNPAHYDHWKMVERPF